MYEITVVVADENGQTSSATAIITINARLDTRAWALSTINGQPLLPGSAITLQFLNGQLAGFAGCNDYNGSYTAVDNGDGTFDVTVDRLNTGRRACPQDVMTQEDNFTNGVADCDLCRDPGKHADLIRTEWPAGLLPDHRAIGAVMR